MWENDFIREDWKNIIKLFPKVGGIHICLKDKRISLAVQWLRLWALSAGVILSLWTKVLQAT